MGKLSEADWKAFRKRVPEWRERYLEEQNKRIATILLAGKETPTERFWEAQKEIEAVARILSQCLEGDSRSKMEMHLLVMYRNRVIGDEDLEAFSEELRKRLQGVLEAFS